MMEIRDGIISLSIIHAKQNARTLEQLEKEKSNNLSIKVPTELTKLTKEMNTKQSHIDLGNV